MKLPAIALCMFAAIGLACLNAAGAPEPTKEEKERFRRAAEYSKSARGLSMVVMRDGELLFEDYAPIWNRDKPHLLGTGTMSFVGVLAACAAHDGLLTFDEKASDTLVEWRNGGAKEQLTIRQLLGMCSGIEGVNPVNALPTYRHAVMTAESSALAGERFSFGPVPVQCFGELLRRKLAPQNLAVGDYIERRLLGPLGLRVAFWRRDVDNDPILYSGAFLTAGEWAKLGELLRTGGRSEGHEVVRADLLAAVTQAQPAQPAYGLGWWLLGVDDAGSAAFVEGRSPERVARAIEGRKATDYFPPADTIAAMGKGKQRCYVIPSRRMVIVRTGDSDSREFSDHEFLGLVLGPEEPADTTQ